MDESGRSEERPERRFLGWDASALERAAEWLVVRAAEALDLSGTVVVVPGERAGRLLLEHLVRLAEDRGAALQPPEIVSQGGLPELLHAPELPAPDPVLEQLVWTDALRSTPSEALERLLPEPPPSDDAAGWDALATTLVGLHRGLGGEGLSFDAVADVCGSGPGFSDEERWRVLAGIRARALARLRGLGWMDRDEARQRALERLRSDGSRKVSGGNGGRTHGSSAEGSLAGRHLVMIGVAELPGIARRLVRASGVRAIALVHAPADRADDFDELGCLIPERWSAERLRISEAMLRVVDGPGDQADALVRELADLGGKRAAEEITVGVPDPGIVPFLLDRLEEAGVSARVAAGRPMGRTSLVRLLTAMGAYLRTRRFEELAALLRHPVVERRLLAEIPEVASRVPMVLDAFQSLHLQAELPDGALPDGGERTKDGFARDVGALRQRLDRLLGPLGGAAIPWSRWPERLRALLLELMGTRPLDRSTPADREMLEAIRALERVLQALEGLPRSLDRAVGPVEFLRMVTTQLGGGSVPPAADAGAVELLGWLELHLDDAPVLVVTGVNEPHLPEAITADPFLPNRLRTRLGMADNERRWARDLYRMQAILASGRRVRLIAGRRGADGSPLRLSRLLLADSAEVIARRIRRALGQGAEQASEPPPEPASEPGSEVTPEAAPEPASESGSRKPAEPARRKPADPAGTPVTLPPEPDLRDGVTRQELSVTAFGSFLRDPYAFGLERFRLLRPSGDDARELDPLGFGSLAHTVLEAWGRLKGVDRMTGEELEDALLGILDRTVLDRFGEHPLPAVRIQAEQLRERLRAVAAVQAERNRQGWVIRAVEVNPPDPGVPFPVDGTEFYLRGRIDRIDEHPGEGRRQLLDYKTSARATTPDRAHRKGRGENREWIDLQLPLYRHLARGLALDSATRDGGGEGGAGEDGAGIEALERGSPVELGYFRLPSELEKTGVVIAEEWGEAELLEADEAARAVIRRIRAGVVHWDPERSRIGADDPLGPVVGAGTLRFGAQGEGR